MSICGCEIGLTLCPEAERMFRAYRAAADIEHTLFMAVTGDAEDDPLTYDRWRLAGRVKRQALRDYDNHVDAASEPMPEPRSLKAMPSVFPSMEAYEAWARTRRDDWAAGVE